MRNERTEDCLDYVLIAHTWHAFLCMLVLVLFAGHSVVGPSALSNGIEFDARIRRSTHTHGYELFQLQIMGVSLLFSID